MNRVVRPQIRRAMRHRLAALKPSGHSPMDMAFAFIPKLGMQPVLVIEGADRGGRRLVSRNTGIDHLADWPSECNAEDVAGCYELLVAFNISIIASTRLHE
jgi:hypothetical protein